MRIQNIVLIGFSGVLMIAAVSAAQRRHVPTGQDDMKVDVSIALQVAAQPYRFDGKAVCQHAATASIYDVVAEMWTVQQSEGQRSITLTVWRPKNSPGNLFSLSVTNGGKSYVVNTVKVGGAGIVQGSGKVTLTTSGAGGTFTVDARADGAAITGTIKCSAFTAAIAEAGN